MTVSSIFNLIALLVTLAAVFGYINRRWLRFPHTIGLLIIALTVSLIVLLVDAVLPQLSLGSSVRGTLADIDFEDTLMDGVLSFLLFAGALHVDLESLWNRRWTISLLATAGIVLSTAIVSGLMFFGFRLFGFDVPLPYCLVFGALISPTDPVAVMGILKEVKVPETLEAKIAGESLFNDGVGVVLFTVLVSLATGTAGHGGASVSGVAGLVATEVVGGMILGFAAGYAAYRAMRTIDQHTVEILITLALVMATYGVAKELHISGPIAVVVAGLFIGNHGKRFGMTETTREHVETFWEVLDELLNSLLFLAIGFEVVAVTITGQIIGVGLLAIPVLTWGGLRGGISVALALSLPPSPWKPILLATTYGVVIFSIVVQGLTVERVVRAVVRS